MYMCTCVNVMQQLYGPEAPDNDYFKNNDNGINVAFKPGEAISPVLYHSLP